MVDSVVRGRWGLVLILLLWSHVAHTVRGVLDPLATSSSSSASLPALGVDEHLLDLSLDGSASLLE